MDIRKCTVLLLAFCVACVSGLRQSFWKRNFGRRSATVNNVEPENVFFKDDTLTSRFTVAQRGANVVLECEAGGSPVPTVHWLFKGSRVIQGEDTNVLDDEAAYENTAHNARKHMIKIAATRSRLYIDCATHADAGEYTCVAETPNKRISRSTTLKIDHRKGTLGQPACNSVLKRSNEAENPGRIYMWTAQRLELEGADVQLYCRSSGGKPDKTVAWYDRENRQLTSGDEFTILDNGDLLIKRISWERHMGLYRCHVENGYGYDDVSIFLYPTTR